MHHASGSFEVRMSPEAQAPAANDQLPTSRVGLSKTFAGSMQGTAIGTMLAAGAPEPGQPAAYVAIDQFRGSVDGRAGGFLLLHRGTIDRSGKAALSVTIAPDSGTGALAGIEGTLAIEVKDGKHLYYLTYRLPSGTR